MFLEQKKIKKQQNGWIEVICGSMFSGKTEELIRRLKRAQFAQLNIEIFKPKVDQRYSKESIVSHVGTSIKSTVVESSSIIYDLSKNVDVVGIDEAQFFDHNLPEVCNKLANDGIRVIIAGLDMDYLGKPFGSIPTLLSIAEYVTKVHAICMNCGNLATFSHRKIQNKELVLLGEVNEYEPLCRKCYNLATHSTQ